MSRSLLIAAALLAGCVVSAAPATAATPALILRGATLIDATGAPPLNNATIVIKDGRIAAIGRSDDIPAIRGARIIDVAGKYIIPGLMDANVHLDLGTTPEYLLGFDGRYDELILESAQVELKAGVTTVFDTWGPRESLVKVRDAINAGQLAGSRIFLGGNIIGAGGPMSADFFPAIRSVVNPKDADRIDALWEQGVGPALLWMTPQQVREKVSAYIKNGRPDFVKYLSSGHQQMQFIAFSPDAQKVIVEEAHKAGLTAQAHTSSPESLKLEIEAGADLLQHCDISGPERIPDTTLQLIVSRRLPCAALLMTTRYLEWTAAHTPPDYYAIIKTKDDNDRALIAAGAVLLLTTDAGLFGANAKSNPLLGGLLTDAVDLPNELGSAHLLWFKAAIERGMTPMNALLAATRNIAQAYGKSKELGTLEAGKRADLIVLSADPLANPDNYNAIVDIYKDGIRVNRSALPSKRILSVK